MEVIGAPAEAYVATGSKDGGPIAVRVEPSRRRRENAERVRGALAPLLRDADRVRDISLRGVRLGFLDCRQAGARTTQWQAVGHLLGRFGAVETLDLAGCALPTDAVYPVFLAVGGMRDLRSLRLADNRLEARWIPFLARLAARLNHLDLRGCFPAGLVLDAPRHVLL